MSVKINVDRVSGCGPHPDRTGYFEIHFEGVRGLQEGQSNLTIEIPEAEARSLEQQISESLKRSKTN